MKFLDQFRFGCGHCHGEMGVCPVNDGARPTSDQAGPDAAGARLAVSAVVVFLVPLVTMVAGALVAGDVWAQRTHASLGRWQSAGALVGFVIGAVLAKGVLRWIQHRQARTNGWWEARGR